MKEKNSFIMYYEWEEMLSFMSDKQISTLIKAMFSYAKRGEVPRFTNPLLNSNFCIMKYSIDRNNEKYLAKCVKNKENAELRWNNEKCERIKNMRTHKIYADNDNDNDNVNDKDNDNVNDKDNDKNNKLSISSSPAARGCEAVNTYSEDFLKFWSAYPKKTGKGAAYKSYNKLKLTKKEKLDILTALEWQKKSEQWTREYGQFIPYPATYLNQRRWEDEPHATFDNDIASPDKYKDDPEDDFDFNINNFDFKGEFNGK